MAVSITTKYDLARTMPLVAVVVPNGVQPGQAFAIQVRGRRFSIQCPPTARAGMQIQCQVSTTR